MSEQSPSDDTSTIKFGIGQPVRRFEDSRLVTGRGRYQDDVTLPRQAYSVFLRSPHAHARILSIDTQAAAAAPGVLAVYTGEDYAADGLGMPKAMMPRKKADGSPMFAPQRPALVIDRVRYVGDPIAMVIAETLMQAKDAAELIAVGLRALAIRDVHGRGGRSRTRRAYGTRTLTISPTPCSTATRPRPMPPSRGPRMSCGGATSSPGFMRNTWSRAGRSAPTTRSRTATRFMPTSTTPIVSATCSRLRCSRCRRALCGWCATMWEEGSAQRAGSMSSTV